MGRVDSNRPETYDHTHIRIFKKLPFFMCLSCVLTTKDLVPLREMTKVETCEPLSPLDKP